MTTLSVSGQIAVILLHKKLELESLGGTSIVSFCSTAYLMITYFKLAQINEYSIKCIGSWKRNPGKQLSIYDKKLLSKYIVSLQPCRIELGEYGHYRKQGSLLIIGKLVYYTTKGIMLLRKFIPY
jgi:hypothetical protein